MAACAGVVYVGSKVVNRLAVSTQAKSAVTAEQPDTRSPGADAVASIGSEAGVGLDRVWLAESGDGYEFYSNGARVLTQFETVGPQRRFYRFSLEGLSNGSDQSELAEKPVGIVYHLSEGDLLPFADRYNKSLMHHSKGCSTMRALASCTITSLTVLAEPTGSFAMSMLRITRATRYGVTGRAST